MKRILITLMVLISTTVNSNEISLESFVKHGDYLDLQLSPDGNHIAARFRDNNRVYLAILNTKSMQMVGGAKPPKNDIIHSFTWINNERYIFEFAEKQNSLDMPVPTGELFAANVNGSKREQIYGYRASDKKTGSRVSSRDNSYASQEVLSLLEDDDKHILIIEYPWTLVGNTYYNDRKKKPIVSRLNIYSGRKKKLEVLPHRGAQALATKNGEVKFMRWMDDDRNFHSAYREDNDSEWQDLDSAFELDIQLTPLGLSEDEKHIFLSGRVGENEVYTLFTLNLETGEYAQAFNDHATDIEDYILDANGMPAVGVTFPDKSDYVYATGDSRTKKIHKMLAAAFPGQTVDISSRTRDGKTLLVHVRSDINPGEYYIFDRDTLDARFIWANRSWIDPRTMAQKQPFKITTDDDVELNGYLTLPNKSDKKPPMVVMIHGGPHQPGTRDFWEFDSEVQLLANRGFAVMQVNFRGSDGYGRSFIRKGYRQWGGKMIDDIITSSNWAIDNGYVDGENVCAYGASYGGYAALMSAVKAPDLFKCTIGYVGIYDLKAMFTESDIPNSWGGKAYLEEVLGSDDAELAQYSPINHVEKIKANVMLIHGAKDRRTPEVTAEQLQEKLEDVGNAPQYLRYSQSGHGVFDEDSRKDLYQGLIDFLNTNLKT